MKNVNIKIKRIDIILIVFCLIIILPIEYYCMLSIPYADDFSDARGSMEYVGRYGDYLTAALARSWDYWLNFHGAYSGMFFVSYLNALARWGIVGMRVFNAVCMLLFFVSLLSMVSVFCNNSSNKTTLSLSVFFILIFWITNNYMNSEVYTWNNVLCIYVVPLIFVFIGESFYIVFVRYQKYGWIMASICAFVFGGGSINIATIGCGFYLMTAYHGVFQLENRLKKRTLIPFIIAVMSTLFNTIAPGNFVRWGEDSVNILKVLLTSFLNIPKRLWEVSTTTPFLALLLLIFIIIHKYGSFDPSIGITYKHPLIMGIMFVVGCTMVNFSYCLGDRQESILRKSFEDRAFFVQDVTLYILIVLWLFYFAGYIRSKYPRFSFDMPYVYGMAILLGTSLLLIFGNNRMLNLTTPYMIVSMADGSAHDYSDYQEEIMKQVQNGEDDLKLIYDSMNHARRDPFIKGLGLTDNLEKWDGWHNSALAAYYGKNSLEITYND